MTSHQSASALLATCRHLLTGREMQICEHVIERSDPDDEETDPFLIIPDYDDPWCLECADFVDRDEDDNCSKCGEPLDDDDEDTYLSEDATIFRSLEIQFYREITVWIDEQDRAISRHTLLTHALLFAA